MFLCCFSGFAVKVVKQKLAKKGFKQDEDVWEDTQE